MAEYDVEAEQRDYREYNRLLVLVDNAEGLAFVSATTLVKRYLRSEPNPVYAEALLRAMMHRGFQVLRALDFNAAPTFSGMTVRAVTDAVLDTDLVWRTMEYNALDGMWDES